VSTRSHIHIITDSESVGQSVSHDFEPLPGFMTGCLLYKTFALFVCRGASSLMGDRVCRTTGHNLCVKYSYVKSSLFYVIILRLRGAITPLPNTPSWRGAQLIKAGWTIGVLGFNSRWGLGIFLFTTASRKALGPTQPPTQCVRGALSLRVKRPGREADHSPPSSAEVKERVGYTSTPPIALIAWCSVKHRDNFTFTLNMYVYMHNNKCSICKPGLSARVMCSRLCLKVL
jgi:hypothetical protein